MTMTEPDIFCLCSGGIDSIVATILNDWLAYPEVPL